MECSAGGGIVSEVMPGADDLTAREPTLGQRSASVVALIDQRMQRIALANETDPL